MVKSKTAKITPSVLRSIVRGYLIKNHNSGVTLNCLKKQLQSYGYRIHYTFMTGALTVLGGGFLIDENRVYLRENYGDY